MPDKKRATEMTDEELAKRVFPKKVKEELDKLVHKDDEKQDTDSSRNQYKA